MICKDCGREIPDGALFCKYCGARAQSDEVPAGEEKDLNFEKAQKGRRRRTPAKRSNVLVTVIAVVLILGLGTLAAVLIWRGSDPKDSKPEQTVQEQPKEEITATLSPSDAEVEVGKNLVLTPVVKKGEETLTPKNITWKSSDSAVATVSGGIVYGIGEGTAEITAQCALDDDTSVEAKLEVTVTAASVVYTAVVDPANVTLYVGNSATLLVELEQSLESGVEITSTVWSTDNENVAVVANGRVSAVGAGSAVITATIHLSNGQAASANADVLVRAYEPEPEPQPEPEPEPEQPTQSETGGNTNSGSSGTTQQPSGGNSSDYVLANSNREVISYDTLNALTDAQLRLARNEIYARHGRRFQDASLQAYFDSKSWYKGTIAPEDFDASVLSNVEITNIERIKEVEAKR